MTKGTHQPKAQLVRGSVRTDSSLTPLQLLLSALCSWLASFCSETSGTRQATAWFFSSAIWQPHRGPVPEAVGTRIDQQTPGLGFSHLRE